MWKSVAALFVLAVAAAPAFAQVPPSGPTEREAMWPAPTAEDWAKPCRIQFQRTWEDALAVSRETGKPILICVNMDGEIASEHYAGVRYRDPDVAKLYEPYVSVIASVYRHNPRDYDDEGNRILCPRFGSVTCGEHIAIEPILYEKYFDGQRVAPRHIMVEVDGSEVYDVYFRNDVASVLKDLEDGIAKRERKPKTIVRGDRTIVERVASPDIADRRAVEAAYREGDAKTRRKILSAAKELGANAPLELLRQAIFGLDPEMAGLARAILARSDKARATDLVVDALRVPMAEEQKKALVAALERIGETSERARWLASVQEGLTAGAAPIDVKAWSKGGGEYQAPPAARELAELDRAQRARAEEVKERPEDADAYAGLAEASLALAMKARRTDSEDPRVAQALARHLFTDARRNALRAEELEGPSWQTNTVIAIADYYRGDPPAAYERAAAAAKEMPPGATDWNSMAILTIFAEGRYRKIKQAARERKRWSPEWLTDLDAAYSALLHHPLATESQILWHYDFLLWLGANYRATRFLTSILERFPDSPTVHARLRERILADRGVDALERTYARMLGEDGPPGNIEWFAGYASLVAAEFRRRGQAPDAAIEAYVRAIEHFERAIAGFPECRGTADHYVAMAKAGLARLAYEAGNDELAVDEIIASFTRRPDSAGTPDGLGITPAETAQMLMARLLEEGSRDLAAELSAAMEKLDPARLVPREE